MSPLSNLPGPWRWEERNGKWWRIHDQLRIEDGPHDFTVARCPHCGSSDLDRGYTGLDQCNACGGLSRGGKTLREYFESEEEM